MSDQRFRIILLYKNSGRDSKLCFLSPFQTRSIRIGNYVTQIPNSNLTYKIFQNKRNSMPRMEEKTLLMKGALPITNQQNN